MQAWSLAWNTAEVQINNSAVRVIQIRRTGKGCLSYLIVSDGEAAVLDPSVYPYVEKAMGIEIARYALDGNKPRKR